jgi:hypothetical protein
LGKKIGTKLEEKKENKNEKEKRGEISLKEVKQCGYLNF